MDSFFNLSKLFWFLASPDHILVWVLLLGVLALLAGWRTLAGTLLVLDLALWLVVMFLPLGDRLLEPLETRYPQTDLATIEPAGIIVLGGGELAEETVIWGQPQFNGGAERLMVVPNLAERFPEIPILFTGGSGSVLKPDFKGADVADAYFSDMGLSSRLILEDQSRNTFENAINSAYVLGGVPSEPWLLVTSAFHMPRSMGIFQKQGWQVIPYPVDYYSKPSEGLRLNPDLGSNLRNLKIGVREWIGLAVYHYTGKTTQLLPGPSAESE